MKPSTGLIASTAVADVVGVIDLAYAETSPTVADDDSLPLQLPAARGGTTPGLANGNGPAERH